MKKLTFLSFLLIFTLALQLNAQQSTMKPETLWEFGRVGNSRVSPNGQTVLFTITTFNIEANRSQVDIFSMPANGGTPVNITNNTLNESNPGWRPDGKKIGFIAPFDGASQLWEMNPDGTEQKVVSVIQGGITGFGYSPDMKHIFFTKRVKVDVSPKDRYPDLTMANALIYDSLMYRHWDRWHDYTYSHVFVATYSNGTIGDYKDIMENQPYDSPLAPMGGVSQIAWAPDGKSLAYTSKKHTGKEKAAGTNSDIYLYIISTNETRNLTSFNKGYDYYPVFSPDGRYLAWQSMETPGFEADKDRILIMDLRNGTWKDYSQGFDQSSRGFVWSIDSKILYFISGHHATYQVYSLELATSRIKKITNGIHDFLSVAIAGSNILIGERASMSSPTELFRINAANGQSSQLTQINKPLLDKLALGRVEQRWIKTVDDQQMLVWVIYPPGFDPAKKYPALLFCAGGPQNAISQSFSYRWNFQLMAANGYIVVAPNRRGVPTFGQAWNDQIIEDYGGLNMQDLMQAIKEVSKEPFVDENRLGAVGASYGGYSVFWLAGNHNGLFKSFIAHCGMFNFESWYGTTEEMFFANHDLGGPYWAEPRPLSYDFSPHLFVSRWDTPIMVIHGAKDYRVPLSEGMQAFNAAQLRGIPSRLLVFPEENHWVLQPQNSILWQREFFRWLDQWLK